MRSGKASRRIVAPDPIYNSRLLAKFINRVMIDGKKTVARRLVYKALDKIKQESKQDPLAVFEKAVVNISPRMEVRPRRIGGASYQVPIEVRGERREALAIRWLITSSQARSNKEYHTFDLKLAAEVMEAAQNGGGAVKKKEDMQKVANANRAFAHFRW